MSYPFLSSSMPAPAPLTGCSRSGQPTRASQVYRITAGVHRRCYILDEFPEVANLAKVLPPFSHGVEHFISNKGPPIVIKFWRLDVESHNYKAKMELSTGKSRSRNSMRRVVVRGHHCCEMNEGSKAVWRMYLMFTRARQIKDWSPRVTPFP